MALLERPHLWHCRDASRTVSDRIVLGIGGGVSGVGGVGGDAVGYCLLGSRGGPAASGKFEEHAVEPP